jgi:hypothetical protein
MRLRRLFTLVLLILGCLTGNASAQYYPYNPYAYQQAQAYPGYPAYQQPVYYPQAMSAQPMYAQPMYPQPMYSPAPQSGYYGPAPAQPMATPIVVMPDKNPAASNNPRLAPAPPTSLPPAKPPQKYKVMSQPIVEIQDAGPVPGPVYGPSCGSACGPACADNSCRRAWTAACDSCPNDLHRWYFEGGAVLLQPRWHDNPAFVTGPTVSPGTNSFQDFTYDWALSPRVEMGFQACGGWGLRVRYQYFNQHSHDETANAAAVAGVSNIFIASPLGVDTSTPLTGTATAASTLGFQTGDFEFQQEFRWGCWSMRASGGGRVAYLQETYDVTETNALVTNTYLHSLHTFFGGGGTFALEGRRYFPRSHLAMYGIMRGSYLFGQFEQTVTGTVGNAQRTVQDALPMAEAEVGLEWWVNVGRVRLFASAGFMGQAWFGVGNASDSSPSGGGEFNSQSRRDMTLIGLTFSTGIQF